ncbi:hypothetical protein [Deinococcus cellulosilyticus]|uniref:IrrE N-terminal-like domain-containing protein n=1 Tax=Deinococcus cellulosilyticus (strain DSM 18568 / NBRC 106333 / KACC 11606 / 5516J-15) TaxID=1223518 RepID=A0A511MZ19_DEIC1|nr:hypothetical protein [Deinococcus cellulosilyticus]GEM45870.1 hypothetical protein DC3_15050 [Deinococcus cellulosilyticus NBRC 106333 = KACC 11606]
MSYDILHDSLAHIRKLHKAAGYPREYRSFAKYLGVRPRFGDRNYSYINEHGQPFLVLNFENYNRRISFAAMHELAHLALKSAGFEWQLYAEYEDTEIADMYLEKFCDVAASCLIAPDHFVEEAIDIWGYSPMAVRHLSNRTKIDLKMAMNMIIHHDEHASVAGFITSGKTVLAAARHNCNLPLRKWDRLPSSHPVFSARAGTATLVHVDDAEMICMRIPGTEKRLALVISN